MTLCAAVLEMTNFGGDEGDDFIRGGPGIDSLNGGRGNDTLVGWWMPMN